jgi:GH24 family phage-related lysozyme (muramidase)
MTLQALLKLREGYRHDVYLDKLHKPTVGIGHLVTSADKLKVGDKIDDARIAKFFQHDTMKASAAAKAQMAKAKISSPDFLVYLTSVNFQLGAKWIHDFHKTWDLILKGEYKEAAAEAAKSRWNSQSPVRVKDFQGALLRLKPKPTAVAKGTE